MPVGKNPKPRKDYKKERTFNYQIEEYINLTKNINTPDLSFFNVLHTRRSERLFHPLSLHQISNLLWHGAKTKKIIVSESGNILLRRPAPSAGAIHPIDILISLPQQLESRSLYYYNSFSHKLAKLKIDKQELLSFLQNIDNCLSTTNATIIWFAACPERTANKYSNYSSLIWRDAGALLMTIQLTATALNMRSCPLGTLGEPFFPKSFDKKILSAGGLLLG